MMTNDIRMLTFLVTIMAIFTYTGAYDREDPNGNVTIRWDIISWDYNMYIATVTILNFQQYRPIEAPGWQLGWTWARKEVIWSMWGAQATHQGDCSSFKGMNLPHSCEKSPTIVDLLPRTSYNLQSANCCKGGVLSSPLQKSFLGSFQLSVGQTGISKRTVRMPKNFTFQAPGQGYACDRAKIIQPTEFSTLGHGPNFQAMMTWTVTCMFSQFLPQRTPKCCVSLSAFYNNAITTCPTCSCGCRQNNITNCDPTNSPVRQCTSHMCPIRVHWHIKDSYKTHWRVKVTISNFGRSNLTYWTLVLQHPNLSNITQVLSFNYNPLLTYDSINNTGLFYGITHSNDVLNEFVQSEILLTKEDGFTFGNGWGFPHKVIFNGDECVQPPPDVYPFLPSSGHRLLSFGIVVMGALTIILESFL
ncbi:hypothetical protein vseg_002306 [Gypsophila vaccaria]